MGEAKRRALAARRRVDTEPSQPQVVDTLGGRMHVRWDEGAVATPHGQLVFFAEFLAATGVFDRWVERCPLQYKSGNAPDKRDVLGTLLLALLAGHRRYAHITALRGDAVAAQALGMTKIISEDALRRSLARIDEAASSAWLRPSLMHSVREALGRAWVLDIDATIKPLYGSQEGAELGYNPTKPKRPSHALHAFLVANLRLGAWATGRVEAKPVGKEPNSRPLSRTIARAIAAEMGAKWDFSPPVAADGFLRPKLLVLDVQVSSGKQHASVHMKRALGQLLDELGPQRPALVRGDSGYGNEGILLELESRGQPYLLRLRQTAGVQRLVARLFDRCDWSAADSQGCQMLEDTLQLHGWSKKRRVVVVRQRIRGGIARERRIDGKQLRLDLAGSEIVQAGRLWEYAVLVTDAGYPLEAIGQLYRDRADAENAFDELKNQWGLGGFTTQDTCRTQSMARACALVYNWWGWYCRAAHPETRLEAITSRPLLLAAVGKATTHGNQTTLYLTPMHGRADVLKTLLANIGAALRHVKAAAEQFTDSDPWACLLRYICERIAPGIGPPKPPAALTAAG